MYFPFIYCLVSKHREIFLANTRKVLFSNTRKVLDTNTCICLANARNMTRGAERSGRVLRVFAKADLLGDRKEEFVGVYKNASLVFTCQANK